MRAERHGWATRGWSSDGFSCGGYGLRLLHDHLEQFVPALHEGLGPVLLQLRTEGFDVDAG
jgi:hypothetical protein